MADIFLTGSETPDILPPTQDEARAIEAFASDPASLDNLRRMVARAMANAVNDIGALPQIVGSLFTSINTAIEAKLQQEVKGFKPWNLGSPQPRILARAIGTIDALDEFLVRAFGGGGFPTSKLTDEERDFPGFFVAAMGEEVRLVRQSELAPNLQQAIRASVLGYYKSESLSDKESVEEFLQFNEDYVEFSSPPTHTLRQKWGASWNQYFVKIPPGSLDFFASNAGKKKRFGVLDGYYVGEVPAFLVVRGLRVEGDVRFDKIVRKFKNSWRRSEFLNLIGRLSANYKVEADVENAIVKYIIGKDLGGEHTVDTSGASGDLSDREGGDFAHLPAEVRDRLSQLDRFAAQNPGAPVSSKVLELFPELQHIGAELEISVPDEAPAKWPEDRVAVKGVLETPAAFIKRNYEPWLGKGLTRADIRRLDKPLYTALDNWLRRNEMPSDVDLPTLSEQNSRIVQAIEAGVSVRGVHSVKAMASLDAARRRRRGREDE